MRSCSLLCLFICAGVVSAAESVDPDLRLYEKAVRETGSPTDSAALLKLFRDRTPSEQLKGRLEETVRQLGARGYVARNRAEQELIKAGRLALPLLRPALKNPDIEIVRRAERCIVAIEENSDAALLTAAACLLAARKSSESLRPLLDYLPGAGDEHVIESVHHTLTECGIKDGKADRVLLAALSERETARRLAAAVALGRASQKQRLALKPLLKDAEAAVQLQAAIGLIRAGDREAATVLVQYLADAPLPLASQAEEVLCQIAGEKAPLATLSSDSAARRKCAAAWEQWWKENSAGIDWKQLHVETPALGLTLVCEAHLPNGGRVFECTADGKQRWTITCNNPLDAQMVSGNRVLIADCHAGRVIEVDREGKEHWVHACNSPICVQRLPGGNTFGASHNEIWEVKRDGTRVYSFQRTGYIYYARKTRSGVVVVVSSDGVLAEVDTTGKELLRLNLGGMGNWAGVEVLSGGRFLVAKSGANEVVEVDRAGKVLWQVSVRNPNSATRLKNGHTLVSSHDEKCVCEFDRSGKVVWKRAVEGNTFRSRRR